MNEEQIKQAGKILEEVLESCEVISEDYSIFAIVNIFKNELTKHLRE